MNWFKFISFIKEESLRIIDKINITDDLNFNFNLKKTKFDSKYYSYNISFNDNIDLDNKKELNNNKNLLNINAISPIEISNIICNNFIGLNNISNKCYINSILQILLHNEKFIYNILISDKSSNKNTTNTFYNLIMK